MRVVPLLLLCSCTLLNAYSGGKKPAPKADAKEPDAPEDAGPPKAGEVAAAPVEEEEEDDGEEGGVKKISGAMRQFNRALGAKNFDEARTQLGKAQRGVQKASDVTRSHPDFEDIEQLVINARGRLEAAIETDRIERKNAAIDALMRKAETTGVQANRIYTELGQRVPTEEDIGRLDEILAAFADMKSEGSQFLDENRYAVHAKQRDSAAAEFANVRKLARWKLDAMASIGVPLGNGYDAAVAAKDKTDPREQVRLYTTADSSFRTCGQTINDLAADPMYRPTYEIKTRLGVRTFEDTKRGCLELARQARQQADALTWEAGVVDVIASIKTPMSVFRGSGNADEELKAARAAAEALSKCMHNLDGTERKPGFDSDRTFDTTFGKLNATALRSNCKGERDQIVRSLPTIEWRTTLTPMLERLADAKRMAMEGLAARDTRTLVEAWTGAVGGYRECVERAKKAQKTPGADRDLELTTAAGGLTVPGIEKHCDKEAAAAQKALDAGLKRRDVEDFASTCRGDEKEVVDREGIPTRIETFNDGRRFVGRIFIYDKAGAKGATELRRFAFDQTGKRVDYWVEWRNEVVQVVAELGRVLSAVKKAKDAGEQVKAVETAMPILDVCKEVLTVGLKSPGFDGKSSFETPLGKVTVPQLIPACVKEHDKLQVGLVSLGWRARLEELAKRVDEAVAQMDKAAKLEAPDRIEIMGGVLGSLAECTERAQSLPTQPGADKKLKLKTVKGTYGVTDMGKACGKLRGEAQAMADKAVAEKKLGEFLKDCKGDEIEVARREGMPEKIEESGGGRIFVYGGKGKKKRFAFDAAGKRVDEKLLGAK
jgi:hypothetical protein